jgi:hypothetical protein
MVGHSGMKRAAGVSRNSPGGPRRETLRGWFVAAVIFSPAKVNELLTMRGACWPSHGAIASRGPALPYAPSGRRGRPSCDRLSDCPAASPSRAGHFHSGRAIVIRSPGAGTGVPTTRATASRGFGSETNGNAALMRWFRARRESLVDLSQ